MNSEGFRKIQKVWMSRIKKMDDLKCNCLMITTVHHVMVPSVQNLTQTLKHQDSKNFLMKLMEINRNRKRQVKIMFTTGMKTHVLLNYSD